jgi:hypothetical protein
MGIKRLGHEASGVISFIEWRPATMSLFEAEDLSKLLLSGTDASLAVASKIGSTATRLESLDGGEQSIERWLGKLKQLPPSERTSWTSDVENLGRLLTIGQTDADAPMPAFSAEQLSRGLAAVELGKYSELGKGCALTASSNAGAKFYEGGPYKGQPLDPARLRENMIVQDGIEKVMGCVGGAGGAVDWASMWPYGVFTCSYEFEEKPLV